MNDEIIKVIIGSSVYENTGLYNATKKERACENQIKEFLKERLGSDDYFEFENLLSDYLYEYEQRTLVTGFKLGVNLMREATIQGMN